MALDVLDRRAASGCTPGPPGWRAASSSVSVRCTMPRKSRRLVRTLKIVGAMIRSRCASASAWSSRITSFADLRVGVAEVGLDPGLPVGVAHGRRAAGEHELAGDEVVVGDGVGGEVAEVAEPEGAQRVRRRPGRGSPGPRASSGNAGRAGRSASRWRSRRRCCRRGSRTDRRGAGRPRRLELRQVREDGLAEIDVRARGPGVGGIGEREEHEPDARRRRARGARAS